jgi:hypothetical protein
MELCALLAETMFIHLFIRLNRSNERKKRIIEIMRRENATAVVI